MAHTLRTLGRPVLGAIVAALGALATPAHGQWMLYRTDPYAVYPPYVDNVPRYTYVSPYHYSPGYTVPGHYEMISGQTPPVTMAVPRYSYNSSYHAAPGYTIPGHFAALPGPVVPQRVPVAPPRRKPVPPATEEPTPNSHYNAPVRRGPGGNAPSVRSGTLQPLTPTSTRTAPATTARATRTPAPATTAARTATAKGSTRSQAPAIVPAQPVTTQRNDVK
ncbi:MAG TPA: hypothetical protein VGZ22_08675 [Isosphaeraceae bacterium]|jgi:hypothetical protein|nr:hypothetical protein [Isosphaeraceae bacterium]